MSLKALLLLGALSAAGFASTASTGAEGKLRVRMDARELFIQGEEFFAEVELSAVGGEVDLAAWRLTPSAFSVNGKPIGSRSARHKVVLAEGDSIQLRFDLEPHVSKRSGFKLACDGSEANPVEVTVLERSPVELDFMELAPDELSGYRVYMRTNRGDMLHEMWPHLAENHVRNFLDLAQTGFYDGTTFHRVMAGFMIQGGDPMGTGGGVGPRQLKPEFSKELHLRGILSMARGEDPHSASCQFFVMHGDAPGLDGNYSIFGKMLIGYDTLDAIVSAPGKFLSQSGDIHPTEDQVIERAVVVLATKNKK